VLLGRDHELAALRNALVGASAGRPFVIGFAGDDGSGRSSLLAAATDEARAAGALVLAARGTAGDPGPAYGALVPLLRPLEQRLDELAGGEAAAAVRTALALRTESADAIAVGLGVLRVVTSAAEHQPVVIVVDDAAGVDEATRSAISFTLTRLGIDQVGAFLGLPVAASPWDAVVTERIVLGRLGTADLVAIVRAAVDCDDQVAEACAGWSAGSPLLALELARSLSVDERRGRSPLPKVPRATGRAVDRLQDRLDLLPEGAKRACVVVAAARGPRVAIVRAALTALGEPDGGLDEAEDAGVLLIDGDEVAFTHPLLRPLSYHLVAASSRRAAHRALAAVMTEPRQAAERAWHLADGAAGPDDDVAAALDLVAADARRRGALADSAAALQRAAALSEDRRQASHRRRAAAVAHLDAFDFDAALALVDPADGDEESALLAVEAIERRDGAPAALGELPAAAAVGSSAARAVRGDLLLASGRRADAARELDTGGGSAGCLAAHALAQSVTAALDPSSPLPPEPGDDTALGRRARRRWLLAAAARGVGVDDPQSVDELMAAATALARSDPRAARELVERARAIVPATAVQLAAALAVLAERYDTVAVATTPIPEVVAALTKAERRVAEAVAAGRTNREVADHLFVSVKTVDFHLQAIYRKLDVRSRTELAVLMATDRREPKGPSND
jgi:DNA-binding NarL/FixJ family response regulator